MDRDVDELLRRNAERQLAGFDRDRQRQMVTHRLETARVQRPRRVIAIRVVAGAAAVLVLMAGYVGMSLLLAPARSATGPTEPPVTKASAESDPLLASTDPTTILMTGPMRLLALNDPMLTPHSWWDQ